MTILIDAQLPKSIGQYFATNGCTIIHTTLLPLGNATSDQWLIEEAEKRNAVVITKDSDFLHSFLLHKKPPKLVLVKVGNMRLKEIKWLFESNSGQIISLLADYSLIEIHPDRLVALE
ncbi:MAG TPA: DUF5615 family PIN-like protein [Saprospiraceae bacterium]|nr:DUF5615 family PIN-like protein [Saprospiraceae bacterium]